MKKTHPAGASPEDRKLSAGFIISFRHKEFFKDFNIKANDLFSNPSTGVLIATLPYALTATAAIEF